MSDYTNGFSFTLSEPCDNIDLFMAFYDVEGWRTDTLHCHYDSADAVTVGGGYTSPYGDGCDTAGTLCGVGVTIDCNKVSNALMVDGSRFVGSGRAIVWAGYMFE